MARFCHTMAGLCHAMASLCHKNPPPFHDTLKLNSARLTVKIIAMIEPAKSGRARCRKCREKIEKGELRLGVEVEGYSDDPAWQWYHLTCAAEKVPAELNAALEAWDGEEIEGAEALKASIAKNKKKQKASVFPYAERAPSARSTCIMCSEKAPVTSIPAASAPMAKLRISKDSSKNSPRTVSPWRNPNSTSWPTSWAEQACGLKVEDRTWKVAATAFDLPCSTFDLPAERSLSPRSSARTTPRPARRPDAVRGRERLGLVANEVAADSPIRRPNRW